MKHCPGGLIERKNLRGEGFVGFGSVTSNREGGNKKPIAHLILNIICQSGRASGRSSTGAQEDFVKLVPRGEKRRVKTEQRLFRKKRDREIKRDQFLSGH